MSFVTHPVILAAQDRFLKAEIAYYNICHGAGFGFMSKAKSEMQAAHRYYLKVKAMPLNLLDMIEDGQMPAEWADSFMEGWDGE